VRKESYQTSLNRSSFYRNTKYRPLKPLAWSKSGCSPKKSLIIVVVLVNLLFFWSVNWGHSQFFVVFQNFWVEVRKLIVFRWAGVICKTKIKILSNNILLVGLLNRLNRKGWRCICRFFPHFQTSFVPC
jgi:hypothetical protein